MRAFKTHCTHTFSSSCLNLSHDLSLPPLALPSTLHQHHSVRHSPETTPTPAAGIPLHSEPVQEFGKSAWSSNRVTMFTSALEWLSKGCFRSAVTRAFSNSPLSIHHHNHEGSNDLLWVSSSMPYDLKQEKCANASAALWNNFAKNGFHGSFLTI